MRDLKVARETEVNYKTAKADIWRQVQTDKERYLEMFFSNWFNNNWARPLNEFREPKPYQARKKPTPEELKAQRKADANLRGNALMNMFLSDGETRLKDATGKQIRQELGWFQVIAKYVKPNEIVGRKLTAQQVANLREQTNDITKPPRGRAVELNASA
jgi:hypothetical protein